MKTFTARTPLDLLAIVPYVIGFHPEDSVVLLTLGKSGGPPTSFHARVDLPVTDAEQRSVSRMLRDVVRRHGVQMVGVVIYSDDVAACESFADRLVPGLVGDGVGIVDVIRADGERFHAVDDPEDPGTPYDLGSHPFTAAGVLEGRVVFESRAAVRDSLVGTDAEAAEAVAEEAARVLDRLSATGLGGGPLGLALTEHARWLDTLLSELVVQGAAPPSTKDAARVLVLVSFEAVREVAWAPMTRHDAHLHVELWRGLVRRAPADLVPGASGLLGFAAWLAGDGALAWCAVDRCLEADPDDPLAHYVAMLVDQAVPPSVWAPQRVDALRIFAAFGADPQAS
ncbi:MAG: DUF4192 domain-containing protein [Marmoricola sp.]